MNKEEREFVRWMFESAKDEHELNRAYLATEFAYGRKQNRIFFSEEKPIRKRYA